MTINDEFLDEIIEDAEPKILRKAEDILVRNRIFELQFDEDLGDVLAKVLSDSQEGFYEVEINNLSDDDDYTTRCSCPYDRGGNCKHITAVALAAKQQRPAVKLPELKKEASIYIQQPWHNSIYHYAPTFRHDYYNYQVNHKIKITGLTEYGFILQYSCREKNEQEDLRIETEGTQLVITGAQGIRKNKLSVNMWMALNVLAEKIKGLQHLEHFMESVRGLKHTIVDPLLKDYGDYIGDKDIDYMIQNGKAVIAFKDSSLVLPPHINHMKNLSAATILSNRLTYNANLLPGKQSAEEWGYGFFMVSDPDNPFQLLIQPLKGKWNKERNTLKSNLSAINFIDNKDIFNAGNDFLRLAVECQRLQDKSFNRFNGADNNQNPELYQVFASKHQTLLNIIPRLSDYPFYVTAYAPSQWDKMLRKNDSAQFTIEKEPLRLQLNCNDGKKFFECKPQLLCKDEILSFDELEVINNYFLKSKSNVLYYLATADEAWLLHELADRKKLKTPLKLKDEFVNNYLLPISKKVRVIYNDQSLVPGEPAQPFTHVKLYLSELGEYILLQPHLIYGQREVELFSQEEYVKDEGGKILHIVRQKEMEDDIKNFFLSLHPDFVGQVSRGFLYLHHREMLRDSWFMDMFEKLKERNIEALGFNQLSKLKYNPHRPSINLSVGSGIDWFDIKIKVEFGGQTAELSDVRRAVLRKEQYVTLKDGSIGILPNDWLEKYGRYLSAGEVKKDGIQISKFHFTLLDDFDENLIDVKTMVELRAKRKRLKEFEEIKEVDAPLQLKAQLRDYQLHGLAWLNFLDEFGWGGCLADDMGLGKTIQCIAFLLQQIEKEKAPNLVVMPTTLLFNWEQELKKFAPSINYHVHYGAEREEELLKQTDAHLILTSYGIMLRDIETFKEIEFNYIILDESQAIKNPASQRYKAIRLLQSRNRMAMTGTPVENNTMELYSQFNFLNPGIFGAQDTFRKDYAGAIDKENNTTVADKLRRIIKPFLIRRTKEQVAKELPGKSEMTLFCEMGEQQRRVYEAFKEKIRKDLLEKIETEGMNKARFAVLDGLLKLRQICNSPALLNTKEDYGSDSVKIEEILRSIKEKTGQHKVLVFSQFVGMLSLIRQKLDAENINYEYLDGQSRKRKESVENFQQNENCRIFLISLKAGGTGLNLTAADYVYIVDPWWNPAVEDQAIDRTYRIGQDKKVFAYRMICHNTIEEKILKLQEKKKKVAKDIIGTEDGFVKALSKEDVMDLLI